MTMRISRSEKAENENGSSLYLVAKLSFGARCALLYMVLPSIMNIGRQSISSALVAVAAAMVLLGTIVVCGNGGMPGCATGRCRSGCALCAPESLGGTASPSVLEFAHDCSQFASSVMR